MDEKNVTKISLSTLLLIIAIIVIAVMCGYIYKLNNDKALEIKKSTELQSQVNSLNGSISNLQGKINSISETINSNKTDKNEIESNSDTENAINENNNTKISFSDLMDLLYIKDKTKGDGNNIFYKFIFDSNDYYDVSGNSNISAISVLDKTITIIDKNKNNTEKTINGINEEVVSVKIDAGDDGVKGIVFLTRSGNVFYLTSQSINKNEFKAKQISKLSQIVKIETVTATSEGASGSAECIMAVNYDGSYEGISLEDI